MKSPAVLMFGWEFPPVMSGGLGVACLGLSKALAPLVNLKMVIPKSTPEFVMKNMELIGMNNISVKKLKNVILPKYYQEIVEVNYIDYELNPYLTSFEAEAVSHSRQFFKAEEAEDEKSERFVIHELYGHDVIQKVVEFARLAVRLGMTKEFDIIHVHDWMTFLPGMHLKQLTGKPLVVHVHSLEYDRGGERSRNWVYYLEKQGMEVADAIIPVSHYTGNIIHEYYGIDRKKIFPVHNGIEPAFHGRNHPDFPEPIVLFLGRVTMQKGPWFFVQIAEKVLKHVPDVHFVLAGTGNQASELIELGAEKGIGDRLHFTGFANKEQVNRLLSMVDVYCMPSVSEPFGLSAVEAAQFEIPCVISTRSGVSEVLKGSLKADFWDTDKFADYIIALLKHESLRKEIVEEANIDLKSITWEITADKVLNVYHDLMAKRSVPKKEMLAFAEY